MYVKLRSNDSDDKCLVVRMGEDVVVHSLPNSIPLSVVDTCHPVTLKSVRTDSKGVQHATVSYNASIQRVIELPTSHLRAVSGGERSSPSSTPKLNIGDHVEVVATATTLFVPVGSEGTVLGGGGGDGVCTASFTIYKGADDTPITLTQDWVPTTCLKFIKEGDDEKSASSTSSDEEEEEEEDDEDEEDKETEADEKKEEEEEEEEDKKKEEEEVEADDKKEEEEVEKDKQEEEEVEGGDDDETASQIFRQHPGVGLGVLKQTLSPDLYEALIQVLDLEELDVVAKRIVGGDTPPTDVDEALTLLDDE